MTLRAGCPFLKKIIVEGAPELAARVQLIKADRLEELGRTDEAEELRAIWGPIYEGNDGDIMVDLDDVLDDIEEPSTDSDADSSPNSDVLDEDVLDEEMFDEDLVETIDVEHAETDGSDETPDAARAAEGFVQDSFDFAGSLDKALEEDQDLDLNEAEGKDEHAHSQLRQATQRGLRLSVSRSRRRVLSRLFASRQRCGRTQPSSYAGSGAAFITNNSMASPLMLPKKLHSVKALMLYQMKSTRVPAPASHSFWSTLNRVQRCSRWELKDCCMN